jgi:molybdate/tungstate transport system ATP-binding protein
MIHVERLSLNAGSFRLQNISFVVPAGKYAVLMGSTGCGKTTLLESVIGLRKISEGRIVLNDRDVTGQNPAARGVGYVPQDGALFSRMTVREHLSFALEIRRWRVADMRDRVRELSDLLGISHLLDRRPHGLSGGERQRVSLGRALSFRPGVLCLDEPLSALDEETRGRMCDLLRSVSERTHVTTLHVTHNPEEARILGDCWLQVDHGRVENAEPRRQDSAG